MHRHAPLAGDLFLHGIGHFHPENRIDNAFLTGLDIGTDDAWIMERVGIRARRTVLALDYIVRTRNEHPAESARWSVYTNAETGARAARLAMERAGVSPSQIGLVIAGGCSPQYSIPAEACQVAAELGISAPAYDVSSACSSFAVQMHYLRGFRPEALPDYVLVLNIENTTRTVDYSDRRTAVLWGDGSAAAVVSARVPAPVRIRHSVVHSNPAGWNKVVIPSGGHFIQEGAAVQGFAIRKSVATLHELTAHADPARGAWWFIGHQANLMMLNTVCQRAEIDLSRHLFNVDEFGNCAAAGAPSVLSQHWDRLPAEAEIALVVVGSGLTWGGLLIDVGEVLVKYADFLQRTAFSKVEVLGLAHGTLVEDPPAEGLASLPAPPMLMVDRIVEIAHRGPQGRVVAEFDVLIDAWFFQCHFRSDPVQPGCLGVDAIWQLIGFYAAMRGARGAGRALGAKEVEFSGQIRPYNKLVRYEIDIRRYAELADTGAAIAIGTGRVLVDGEPIYLVKDAKVGIFRGIRYADYPAPSANSVGGLMSR